MKNRNLLLVLFLCSAVCMMAQTSKQNFDFDWRFIEQDVNGAEAIDFDMSKWESVDLPHDWDITHTPSLSGATDNGGGYYPGGIGWYCKEFTAPKLIEGEKLVLHFEGVYQRCTVFVNGKEVATHGYGYTPFRVDITPYVNVKNNLVAVRVDNSQQPNCRWYSGSGIYRHVWLETYREGVIDDPQQLFVRTEKIYGISADGSHADSATVRITYSDKINETRTFRNVNLWSPMHPALYDISVGELCVKHGFRYVEYDAEKGFRLNGQPVLINGACVHHDDGLLGARAYDDAEIRKVRLMKESGFNLIRTSHNPQTRAFLDACDSLGMMVIDEAFDGWYSEKTPHDYHEMIDSCYQEDISAMVLRDRNHPSIICWSIGNEVMERKDIRVIHTARKFKNVILSLDSTRPVTEALCSWDDDWEIYDPHAEVLDIVGYNYMMHKAEGDHERCPERVMWQTESYPRDAFKNWDHTDKQPYIIGDIVWTGLDYLGESGIGQFYYDGEPRGEHYIGKHFPFHGAYCGDVDITGWRKPISHYRSLLWNAKDGDPDVYMAVKEPDGYTNGIISETQWSVWPTWESWNWKGWDGKPIEVEVYTKAPMAKLYLNGTLIASKAVSRATEYKAVFSVPYTAGELKAVSCDADGEKLSQAILSTAGEPDHIRLTADRTKLTADGESLAFISVEIVDKDGNVVPDADLRLLVGGQGQGKILAAGNASMKSLDPYTGGNISTYKGRAMVVVCGAQKSSRKKGHKCKFKLSVESSIPSDTLYIVSE